MNVCINNLVGKLGKLGNLKDPPLEIYDYLE